VGRTSTYKNLSQWYTELREHCPKIPTIVVANKIDINKEVTKKAFNFMLVFQAERGLGRGSRSR
jgi:Rab-like protein 2